MPPSKLRNLLILQNDLFWTALVLSLIFEEQICLILKKIKF